MFPKVKVWLLSILQMDKNTGQQTSASSLTWSYANILHALHTRKSLLSFRREVLGFWAIFFIAILYFQTGLFVLHEKESNSYAWLKRTDHVYGKMSDHLLSKMTDQYFIVDQPLATKS